MVRTPKARNHFTPLLVLTPTLVGLAGGLTVPVDSAKWPAPTAFIDQADASPPAGQTGAIFTPTAPDVTT
jgi:hypothetical protein